MTLDSSLTSIYMHASVSTGRQIQMDFPQKTEFVTAGKKWQDLQVDRSVWVNPGEYGNVIWAKGEWEDIWPKKVT